MCRTICSFRTYYHWTYILDRICIYCYINMMVTCALKILTFRMSTHSLDRHLDQSRYVRATPVAQIRLVGSDMSQTVI